MTSVEAYRGQVIVFKFGGALADEPETIANMAAQIAFAKTALGIHLVGVHGGGAQIDAALKLAGIESQKDPKTHLRITTHPALQVMDAQMGVLNANLCAQFNAVAPELSVAGFAGGHDRIVCATPIGNGDYTALNPQVDGAKVCGLIEQGVAPLFHSVCASLAPDVYGEVRCNVNADDVAASLAIATGAKRLVFFADVKGVLDRHGALLSCIHTDQIEQLIADKDVGGGMAVKLRMAAKALHQMPDDAGVVILDGRSPNALRDELTKKNGGGTLIKRRLC